MTDDTPSNQRLSEEHRRHGTVKETLTSLVIAFIMAFVFRAFVLEAFLIPTGSMAPTLLGAHMRIHSDQTGSNWSVGPWYYADDARQLPMPRQGTTAAPVVVHDPITGPPYDGIELRRVGEKRLAGDRIFVLKYLYSIFDPERFDVVVFKNPTLPTENYIKRLAGLPGEQVALIDGDVFRRAAGEVRDAEPNAWSGPGWMIQRKTESVLRACWNTVFDSSFAPRGSVRGFGPPWRGAGPGWSIDQRTSYLYEGDAPTALNWNHVVWPVTDYIGYNEIGLSESQRKEPLPVSDVRLSAGVKPEGEGMSVRIVVRTRGHAFAAEVEGSRARLSMTPLDDPGAVTVIDEAELPASVLAPGRVTNLELWHADQALWLFVDDELVAGGREEGAYDWTPRQRVEFSTGNSLEFMSEDGSGFSDTPINKFADAAYFRAPELAWEFGGGSFELFRVRLDKDLHYRAEEYPRAGPASKPHARRGLHPVAVHPSSSPVLGPDQFFVCGDNSAYSLDGRLWDRADPWVRDAFEHADIGVVPRELLIGKAFFVYFPAIQSRGMIPVPDFGRLRFIW